MADMVSTQDLLSKFNMQTLRERAKGMGIAAGDREIKEKTEILELTWPAEKNIPSGSVTIKLTPAHPNTLGMTDSTVTITNCIVGGKASSYDTLLADIKTQSLLTKAQAVKEAAEAEKQALAKAHKECSLVYSPNGHDMTLDQAKITKVAAFRDKDGNITFRGADDHGGKYPLLIKVHHKGMSEEKDVKINAIRLDALKLPTTSFVIPAGVTVVDSAKDKAVTEALDGAIARATADPFGLPSKGSAAKAPAPEAPRLAFRFYKGNGIVESDTSNPLYATSGKMVLFDQKADRPTLMGGEPVIIDPENPADIKKLLIGTIKGGLKIDENIYLGSRKLTPGNEAMVGEPDTALRKDFDKHKEWLTKLQNDPETQAAFALSKPATTAPSTAATPTTPTPPTAPTAPAAPAMNAPTGYEAARTAMNILMDDSQFRKLLENKPNLKADLEAVQASLKNGSLDAAKFTNAMGIISGQAVSINGATSQDNTLPNGTLSNLRAGTLNEKNTVDLENATGEKRGSKKFNEKSEELLKRAIEHLNDVGKAIDPAFKGASASVELKDEMARLVALANPSPIIGPAKHAGANGELVGMQNTQSTGASPSQLSM